MNGPMALVRDCLRAGSPIALATVIELVPQQDAGAVLLHLGAKLAVRPDDEPMGSMGELDLERVVIRDAQGALDAGSSVIRHYGLQGQAGGADVTVFIEVFAPSRRMLIFGAVDFTAALVRVAKVLDYRVTVCDARPEFATATRFPDADEVVVDWPHRHLSKVAERLGPLDAICLLTHDHKFDIPALVTALDTKVGYVGAMGSRTTQESRVNLLRAEGIQPEKIEQIMAPIGLDIGARTPEETAVSICAEIIAQRSRGTALSLKDGSGPIHRTAS